MTSTPPGRGGDDLARTVAAHFRDAPYPLPHRQQHAHTPRLADVVYDVTGDPAVFTSAQRPARRFGRLVLPGDAGTPSRQRLVNGSLWRDLCIVGAFSGDPLPEATDHHFWTRRNMALTFFDYPLRGRMQVDDLITRRFSPLDAAEVYPMLLSDRGETVGVVFDWTGLSGDDRAPRGGRDANGGNA